MMLFDWIIPERSGGLTRAILPLYNEFAADAPAHEITVGEGFGELARIFYSYYGEPEPVVHEYAVPCSKPTGNGEVLVGFSGGLDSAYQALSMEASGWKPILYHVSGLNRRSPDEDVFARRFAEASGFDYMENKVRMRGRQRFPDNPVKNQLIMCMMADDAARMGIGDLAMGEDWGTGLEGSNPLFTVTDSVEVNKAFVRALGRIAGLEVHFIGSADKKLQRLRAVRDRGLLQHVAPCIGPYRFKKWLRKNNEAKYGVHLLPGRCGSCYKCCMESLLLAELGEELPAAYASHCWNVLSDSWQSHTTAFNKKRPLEERRAVLLSYGS